MVFWPSSGPSSPATNSQWDSDRDSDYATPDADVILPERFLDCFIGMFWIVIFLERPVVAELELLCRFLQVLIKDLDVFLLSQDFLYADWVPCILGIEASP